MNNATRIAVAAAALSALAVVACTADQAETPSVEVQQGTVDPNCIRGGLTCGTTTYYGGKTGGLTSGYVSSSGVLDPGTSSGTGGQTLNPPKGADPVNCGDGCKWSDGDATHMPGCQCSGGGNGLQSGIVCPVAYPCRYYVWGAYRCYAVDSWSGTCH